MAKIKVTPRTIAALKPGPKRIDYFDTSLPGFCLRVTPNGGKTFAVLYRHAGRLRRYTIGPTSKWDLKDAREEAREALRDAARGTDRAAQKQQDRIAETFAELAHGYIEDWARPRKKSWREDQRIIESYLLPLFRHARAKDISRADVRAMLRAVAKRGPIMANRVLSCLSKIYAWGVSEEIVDSNPCQKLTRPGVEKKRDRVLTPDEIQRFWKALDDPDLDMTDEVRAILRLTLTTAQRPGECAAIEWAELDAESGWWTVPSGKSKAGRAHRVPLSALAQEILKARPREGRYLFSRRDDKPIRVSAVTYALRRNKHLGIAPFGAHDLRRTAASRMPADRFIKARILGHTDSSQTGIYDLHEYSDEKKRALDGWGRKLRAIISGKAAQVVSLG